MATTAIVSKMTAPNMAKSVKMSKCDFVASSTSNCVSSATTSQAEADQKRGRQLRQREERLGKLQREYDSLTKKCSDGDRNACQEQQRVYAEIQLILPTVPVDASDPRYH